MVKNVLSLFSGAGGAVEGLKQAGYNIVGAVDFNEYAVKTLQANYDDLEVMEADLTEVTPEYVVDNLDLSKDDIDVVVGGPPCQDFSVANRYSRGGERTNLVFVFADYVNYIQPEKFVMENVEGMLSTGTVFEDLLDEFEDIGYDTTHDVHNSENFGVPQRRKRVVVIGDSDSQDTVQMESGDIVTVGEAFSDLSSLEAGESDDSFYNHKAPNHQDSTVEKMSNTEFGEPVLENWGSKIRLDPNEVAPTLKAGKRPNYHFAHPYDDRGLTVRERARLQTFPDEIEFVGPVTQQRRQTGNAVPPKMMKKIGEALY